MKEFWSARAWACLPPPRNLRVGLLCSLMVGAAWAQYTVTTVAGNGNLMYSGDNVPARHPLLGLVKQGPNRESAAHFSELNPTF
jgi:hypothetical protein